MEIPRLQKAILAMGVEVEPITEDDCTVAARIIEVSRLNRQKRDDPCLSLGDGLCIAVAERLNLVITGGDNYWGQIWPHLNLAIQFHPFR
jgi:PIN domain nuclease of toxin-antitoxin system